MPTRLENSIRISVPDIWEEVKKLPDQHSAVGKYREEFLQCFRRELAYCITRALRATEGQVIFGDLQIPSRINGQYVMQFEVFDASRPRSNAYNFHGQNTSQWIYAGCILYQDGSVSTHH